MNDGAQAPRGTPLAAPKRILLIGLMGAGKSTVGRLLASRLGWAFRDSDEMIVARAGRSIAAIFEEDGEARFRALERAVLEALAGDPPAPCVVALGGGAALAGEPYERLAALGPVVWLRVRPDTALARLRADERAARPLLDAPDPRARLAALLAARESAYARAALALETDDAAPEDLATRVATSVA